MRLKEYTIENLVSLNKSVERIFELGNSLFYADLHNPVGPPNPNCPNACTRSIPLLLSYMYSFLRFPVGLGFGELFSGVVADCFGEDPQINPTIARIILRVGRGPSFSDGIRFDLI